VAVETNLEVITLTFVTKGFKGAVMAVIYVPEYVKIITESSFSILSFFDSIRLETTIRYSVPISYLLSGCTVILSESSDIERVEGCLAPEVVSMYTFELTADLLATGWLKVMVQGF